MFDEAHGATLSAVWGSWARYVYQLDIERFANYGKKVWNIELDKAEEAAIAAIEKTEEFFRALDMPVSIGELSIGVQPDEDAKKMAESATKGGISKTWMFQAIRYAGYV